METLTIEFLEKNKIKWRPTNEPPVVRKGYHKYLWCVCICGTKKLIYIQNLKRAFSRNCANCANVTHGQARHGIGKSRLYTIWQGMKHRCASHKHKNYGVRGIKVCREWQEFIPFQKWALENGYKKNLSIDRKDVNGNYTPKNCKWSTQKEQMNNTRRNVVAEYNGKKQNLTQWEKELGFSPGFLLTRYNRGLREKELFKPKVKRTNTYSGITFDSSYNSGKGRWRARIKKNDSWVHIGYADTESEALALMAYRN